MMSTTPPRSETAHGAALLRAGRGEPLVLLHGVGLNADAWRPQMAELSRTHEVIAVDLPGHGASAPLPGRPRLPDFVRWFGQVLDDIGLARCSLAGHSMGALIALGTALEFPDRIARVALLSAVHRRSADARQAVIDRAARLEAGEIDLEAPLARWFGTDDDAAREETRRMLRAASPGGYAAAYRAFAEGDDVYAGRLANLACPALVMTGEDDPNSTPEMSRAMAAAAPHAACVILPGERHMIGLTAPDAVNAALAGWLARPALAETEGAR